MSGGKGWVFLALLLFFFLVSSELGAARKLMVAGNNGEQRSYMKAAPFISAPAQETATDPFAIVQVVIVIASHGQPHPESAILIHEIALRRTEVDTKIKHHGN
ncbi:hypothetical protein SDJN03_17692, partial [Cucurbita argyrosperma subsp. sororia]